MRYRSMTMFVAGILALGSSLAATALQAGEEETKPEAVSLLGKKLFAVGPEGEELARMEGELKEAALKMEADPENVDNIIAYGRSLASLWRYRQAVEVFNRGIDLHPDKAMLYRHRGHRFITLRLLDRAVEDLATASRLNGSDFDIWYHLGLACYLRAEFEEALAAYRKCLEAAGDDDSRIAVSYWLYLTLRRLGRPDEAEAVLEPIGSGLQVEENRAYLDLLFLFKGQKTEDAILAAARGSDLDLATVGYGIGCWRLLAGKSEEARELFAGIVETKYWPAFGFIAAEAELARAK